MMERIVELLNKAMRSGATLFGHYVGDFNWLYYAKNHWRLVVDNLGYTDDQYSYYDYTDRDICGKDGGFIKWLVENDKIELEAGPLYGCQLIMYNRQPYTLYETILMLLAIEENPIDLLCSILK